MVRQAEEARSSWAVLRVLVAVGAFLVVFGCASEARAYPWMIRHGYVGCTTCHADPSGGELLTLYGRAQGDLLLRMRYGKDTVSARASEPSHSAGDSFDSFDSFDTDSKPTAQPKKPAESEASPDEGGHPQTGFMWGLWDTPSWLLLGGAFRHVVLVQGKNVRTFPMQADLYGQLKFGAFRAGGSIGVAKVKAGSVHARAAQVTTNQGDQLNLLSRTHWVGLDFGANDQVALRAGRLNLPFGIRMSEHVMWVRDATQTDRESDQQHGLAVAYNGSSLRGELMGIAGNYQINPDRYRERGYSGFAEVALTDGVAVGASSMVTTAAADRVTLEDARTVRGAHGPFARVRLIRPVVFLAEADVLHRSRRALGYTGMAQLDYELVQGLHLFGTGEVLDSGLPNAPGSIATRVAGAGKPRFGGWLSASWYFLPQLELRVDAIARQSSPTWFMTQLHVYL